MLGTGPLAQTYLAGVPLAAPVKGGSVASDVAAYGARAVDAAANASKASNA